MDTRRYQDSSETTRWICEMVTKRNQNSASSKMDLRVGLKKVRQ